MNQIILVLRFDPECSSLPKGGMSRRRETKNAWHRPVEWVICAAIIALCSLMKSAWGDDAACRDVRETVARESEHYRMEHPKECAAAPKHDWRSIRPQQPLASSQAEIPGGVGFGFYFLESKLLWTNATVLDYYIITPTRVGGDMNYYLYLTSSCRANLGTESFISYYQQDEATFAVYDWAQASPWQVWINLPTIHPQYLADVLDESCNSRQMCRIQNGTYYKGYVAGQYTWRNEVRLYNFPSRQWDLVYSYDYATATKQENTFQSGDGLGFWGPIVEIWADSGTYNNLNPIGFHLAKLYQDDNPISTWLTTANCYTQQMDFFNIITVAPNRSFIVNTGTNDPDGDGQTTAQETLGGSDPNSSTSYFQVASIACGSVESERVVRVSARVGRDYQLHAASTPAAVWTTVGNPVSGSATSVMWWVQSSRSMEFYRVSTHYNAGTLCVSANTNTASFWCSPTGGVASPQWVPTPITGRWEKTIIGLSAGTYMVHFTNLLGLSTPSSKSITVTNGSILDVEGLYEEL